MKQSTIYNQTKSGQLKLLSYGENKFSLAGKFIFTCGKIYFHPKANAETKVSTYFFSETFVSTFQFYRIINKKLHVPLHSLCLMKGF